MPYKRTGNPPGRPRYLPPFNPEIPTLIVREYPSLLTALEEAIKLTTAKAPNYELLWLNITKRFKNKLFNTGRIIAGASRFTLSAQQLTALEWLQKKGKHDWEKQLRDMAHGISRTSTTRKANASKAGTSTGRKTATQPILDTTRDRSEDSMSTE